MIGYRTNLLNKFIFFSILFSISISDVSAFMDTEKKITKNASKIKKNKFKSEDFKIEGLALYNNAIDKFSKKTLESAEFYDDGIFYTRDIVKDDFEKYYAIQVTHKKNDIKKYKIYAITGAIKYGERGIPYKHSFKECTSDYNDIITSFDLEFSQFKVKTSNKISNFLTQKKRLQTVYEMGDGGTIMIGCVIWRNYYKKKKKWFDSLKVSILSKEVTTYLIKEYGKDALYD